MAVNEIVFFFLVLVFTRANNKEQSFSTFGDSTFKIFKLACTYLSFPNIGESPIITDAKADFTCWLGSITKS